MSGTPPNQPACRRTSEDLTDAEDHHLRLFRAKVFQLWNLGIEMVIDEVKESRQRIAPADDDSAVRYIDHLKELEEIVYRTEMRTVELWCLQTDQRNLVVPVLKQAPRLVARRMVRRLEQNFGVDWRATCIVYLVGLDLFDRDDLTEA